MYSLSTQSQCRSMRNKGNAQKVSLQKESLLSHERKIFLEKGNRKKIKS